MEPKTNTKYILITLALILVVAIGTWYYRVNNTVVEAVTPAIFSSYKDGSYTASGIYMAPSGEEKIDITLTIANNSITDATMVGHAENPASKNWQEVFSKNFSQYVIGKNIDTVRLNKVSGSSLTPQGFNDALNKIKIEAKV